MRAMQLRDPAPIENRPLEPIERTIPTPEPGEVVLRVDACGVCRTDLQLAEGDLALHRRPVVPGHQAVGRVVAMADDVQSFRIGDRAGVAWLASACGQCDRCREGRENLCLDARFTGWDRDGGFATHIAVRADFALKIPVSFDDLAAAPLLCGGVIGYRALKISGVRPGQRLGLYGFGASALLALQVARHWGCEVYVATRSAREQARALELGAIWAGGYDDAPPAKLDAAVTFAPVGSVVVAALQSLDRGGTVAINAIHLDGIPAFSYDDLWWERSLRSVANFTRQDARELLELASEIPIRTSFDLYPLEDANRALADLRAGHVNGAAVLDCRA
ncbi:MAG: zinc-dependent alcohol dehydrogenase family protein [Polyangiaceae bacterium]|nr:zinc-dependent alcohol dehydrogenase family protein [Polyangiaceae bacterium]